MGTLLRGLCIMQFWDLFDHQVENIHHIGHSAEVGRHLGQDLEMGLNLGRDFEMGHNLGQVSAIGRHLGPGVENPPPVVGSYDILEKLAQRVARTGGITFALITCQSTFAALVFLNEWIWLVPLGLKLFNVLPTLLAWYWISSQSDIRMVTDALLKRDVERIHSFCCRS